MASRGGKGGRTIACGHDAILNRTVEAHVPVEVETRVASSWGEG
jgi:hypothetical protein